jgi:MFS family permease
VTNGRTTGLGLPRGIWVVAATTAVLMCGMSMVGPFLPVYAKDLGATAMEIGVMMSGFYLGRLVMQLPAGIIADLAGRRIVVLVSLAGYTVSCLGYAASPTATWLLVSRVVQGFSAALFSVGARSLLNDLAGPRLRGLAQGTYASAVGLGFVVGPIVGSRLSHRHGMFVAFLVAAAFAAAALVILSVVSYKSRPRPDSGPLSLKGLGAALADKQVRPVALANLFFTGGFVVIHTLFAVAAEAEIGGTTVLGIEISGGILFFGTALSAAAISGMLLGPIAGRMSDLIGRCPMMLVGVLLAVLEGTSLFLTRDPLIILVCFFLGGVGGAAFSNALYSRVGDITVVENRGTVTGLVGMAGYGGGTICAMLATLTWEHTNLRLPFLLHPVLGLLAIICVIWIWRIQAPVRISDPAGES